MVLHTLSATPASVAFRDCLAVLNENDAVLLLGDGTYAALPDNPYLKKLLGKGAELYLLDDDARAAGVNQCDSSITAIDMDGFVDLTERFTRQMNWF